MVLTLAVYAYLKYSYKVLWILIGVYMVIMGGVSLYFLLTRGITTIIFIVMMGIDILFMVGLFMYGLVIVKYRRLPFAMGSLSFILYSIFGYAIIVYFVGGLK
jgi:hypothetical protein